MQQETNDISGMSDEELAVKSRVSGDLYLLFMEKCPPFIKSTNSYRYLDVERLSEVMGLTRQTIYTWFRKDKLTPARVKHLLSLEGCLFEQSDLVPYMLND